MKQRNQSRIFAAIVVFVFVLVAFDFAFITAADFQSSVPLLILRDGQEEYLLGSHIEYLEDPSQKLGIEQVSSGEYADKFVRGDTDILNFGLKDSAYWLRLTVRNESLSGKQWLLELARPSMNSVFLYTILPDGDGFNEIKTGYVFPFSTRDVSHESFVFHLDIPAGEQQTYYLRVKDMSLDLPLRIWSLHAFDLHDQRSRLVIGLTFGALLVMLAYNTVLLFSIHDRAYVYYAFFQLFIILYLGSVQGYTPRYLWPSVISLNFFVIPLFAELSTIFMLLFAWEFLRPASHAKWLDNIFYIIIALLILLIPPTFVIGAKVLIAVLPLVLVVHLFAFLLGVGALRRGYKPARYYMFAWSIYLIVGIGAVLHYEGWLTIVQIIPDQAVQMGSVYLITLQSLALADRINYYKQENLNAQNRLILQQKETLSLKDELNTTLENARIELEDRVVQRTRELSELNLKLSEEITERKHAEDELKRLASVDFLTGLFNRRHFFEIASREFVKSTRYDRPLSVIIFDIDLFKDVNDTYGHLVGDQVLVHLGHLVRGMARESDIAARYGGEEFVILLPETDCNKAKIFAERLRQSVQDSSVPYNNVFIHITVSVGVSGKDGEKHAKVFDELISQADQSLYKAKSAGRNKVICNWDN